MSICGEDLTTRDRCFDIVINTIKARSDGISYIGLKELLLPDMCRPSMDRALVSAMRERKIEIKSGRYVAVP